MTAKRPRTFLDYYSSRAYIARRFAEEATRLRNFIWEIQPIALFVLDHYESRAGKVALYRAESYIQRVHSCIARVRAQKSFVREQNRTICAKNGKFRSEFSVANCRSSKADSRESEVVPNNDRERLRYEGKNPDLRPESPR